MMCHGSVTLMLNDSEPVSPGRELHDFSVAFPGVWKRVDEARLMQNKGQLGWPKWCYLPFERAYDIMGHYAPFRAPPEVRAAMRLLPGGGLTDQIAETMVMRKFLANILCLISAWRHTKGIYRFDPDSYEEIVNTPLDRRLPCERLIRLPEWCVAIETPGLKARDVEKSHIMVSVTLREQVPTILVNCNLINPIAFPIGRQSILEALEQASLSGDLQEVYAPIVRTALSLALYLCSDGAEIAGGLTRVHLKPTKTRHGLRFFPPDSVQPWQVATRVGAALRIMRAQIAAEADEVPAVEGELITDSGRARPRPHVRRAHWHTYWTGSQDSTAPRQSIVKWIPPILVNARTPEAVIDTVHPVEFDA